MQRSLCQIFHIQAILIEIQTTLWSLKIDVRRVLQEKHVVFTIQPWKRDGLCLHQFKDLGSGNFSDESLLT